MKKLFLSIIMLAAMSAACFAQDVAGRWKLDDGTAIVEIYKSEGIVPQQGGPATLH